jgi:Flp pilus assembly protein TadG
MKMMKDDSGQILALTVLSMTLLIACVALAVDVGVLFRAKRNAQIAADSAAIAGAMEYAYGSGSVTTAADNAALANGFPSSTVTVIPSPTNGYHTGAGFVEVDINQPNPTVFMSMFVNGKVNVGARAVAGDVAGQACVYVLDPTDANALYLQGSADISTPNCGIQVNSSSTSAFCDQGSATVEAPFIHIVGSQSGSGKCGKAPGSTPVSNGSAPVADPFNNLPGPNPATACTGANTVSVATVTAATPIPSTSVTSGTTTASVTCFSSSNVTLSSGLTLGTAGGNQIFVFENGVKIGGTMTVNGTIDVYQGTFSQGNSALTVTAPANKADTYNGIAIMEPSSNTTSGTCKDGLGEPCLQLQFGSGYGKLNGIVYAPTSQVYQQDNGGSVSVTGVIAYQIYLKASTMDISDSYNDQNPSTTPLTKVSLVE